MGWDRTGFYAERRRVDQVSPWLLYTLGAARAVEWNGMAWQGLGLGLGIQKEPGD